MAKRKRQRAPEVHPRMRAVRRFLDENPDLDSQVDYIRSLDDRYQELSAELETDAEDIEKERAQLFEEGRNRGLGDRDIKMLMLLTEA